MARVRIELPDRFPFRTAIALLISHINYGRHLDNAQLLGLVSEARVRFLKSMGYTELDIEGVGILQNGTDTIEVFNFDHMAQHFAHVVTLSQAGRNDLHPQLIEQSAQLPTTCKHLKNSLPAQECGQVFKQRPTQECEVAGSTLGGVGADTGSQWQIIKEQP